eukprot:CAMPEP_0118924952 /NCGR_PEP_ID=MMETSP1169-20130426/2886_1 /TAXON_ID=36882 /ORGANISM="Pyramimonas obovata, Strain CCMP722" /LENGTH=47 /DNA_ID= /DNA_START= /DNA_END= /DNA_ORIENTATION=
MPRSLPSSVHLHADHLVHMATETHAQPVSMPRSLPSSVHLHADHLVH